MTQYIETTNQDLLWNIFQKIPEVSQLQPEIQQGIFRNAISHFYQQMNPNVTLRTDHLKELNKQTITFLLDKVRPRVVQEGIKQPQPQQQASKLGVRMVLKAVARVQHRVVVEEHHLARLQ